MANLTTTTMTYPPEEADVRNLIRAVATRDRDPKGNALLRRPLTAVERQMMQRRSAALAPFIERARKKSAEEAVLAMLIGFGKESEAEAEVVAAQYAAVCIEYGLPLWAIQRACLRFSAGDVKAEEVGEKQLGFKYLPTSAHLRILAEKIAHPVHREVYLIGTTLRGTVAAREVTEEQRKIEAPKIKMMHEAFKRTMAEQALAGEETAVNMRAAAAKRAAESSLRFQLSEYSRLGIDPVYADKDKTILLSLDMMRRRGFEVREIGRGVRALVGPAGERP